MPETVTPDDVLEFWFGDGRGAWEVDAGLMKRWFMKDSDFDHTIRARFGEAIAAARAGLLETWAETPRGRLALIVVLDQFPRNSFRGSAEMFSGDPHALRLALAGLEAREDQQVRPLERVFWYLPLEHAEDLGLQDRAVALFATLAAESPEAGFAGAALDYAKKHQVVIARFGRFPHRNAVLGRESTPEETAFLAEPGSSF